MRKLRKLAGPTEHLVVLSPGLAPGSTGFYASDLLSPLHFLLDTADDHQTMAYIAIVISLLSQQLITSKLILPFSSGELTVIIHVI